MLVAYKSDSRIKKAEDSQAAVVELLESKGFTIAKVNKPSANGIDVVAIKNNRYYLIEVKTVINGTRSKVVNKIHDKADYVFMVMGNGAIFIEDAVSWRNNVGRSGKRSVTSIVRIYDELS